MIRAHHQLKDGAALLGAAGPGLPGPFGSWPADGRRDDEHQEHEQLAVGLHTRTACCRVIPSGSFAGCAPVTGPASATITSTDHTDHTDRCPDPPGGPCMSTVEERVKKVVAETLNVSEEEVRPERSLDELAADNLDVSELIIALEQEFQASLPEEINTVQAVIDWAKR
ncbi:acyl carrier protein [Streptomyces griseofuscus]